MIRTILVPVDFSAHSEKALELACEFASRFGASIHLLHSCEFPRRLVTVYDVLFPERLEQEIYAGARRKLHGSIERVRARGIEVDMELTLEEPSAAILRVARERSCDLVVMGTRGLGALRARLLGSVAEKTLREAPCPVTTVHADPA